MREWQLLRALVVAVATECWLSAAYEWRIYRLRRIERPPAPRDGVCVRSTRRRTMSETLIRLSIEDARVLAYRRGVERDGVRVIADANVAHLLVGGFSEPTTAANFQQETRITSALMGMLREAGRLLEADRALGHTSQWQVDALAFTQKVARLAQESTAVVLGVEAHDA